MKYRACDKREGEYEEAFIARSPLDGCRLEMYFIGFQIFFTN